jgi:hypothetical protein
MHLLDEMSKHRLGYVKVSYYTVLHGAKGKNVTRSAAQHQFGLISYSKHTVLALSIIAYCNKRGFVDYDALPFYVDKGIRCTQINCKVSGKPTPNSI